MLTGYTEICNEAPSDLLLQTVQSEILDFATSELNACKEFNIRQASLKAIGAIAGVLHDNKNSFHVQMQSPDQVLKLVLRQLQLHTGPEYTELYPVVIPVLTSLVSSNIMWQV